jgi:hypothetical protein
MKANISFGIGLFIAVAAFYVIMVSLPLVFQGVDGKPLKSIEPEPTARITTTTIPEFYTPESDTTGTGKTSTPLQRPVQRYGQDQAAQQAEQLLEQEVESAISNQTDEEITDLITGAAVEGLYSEANK